MTPLHLAASLGEFDCARILLAYGARLDACNQDTSIFVGQTVSIQTPGGRTPLHFAAERGDNRMIELFLKSESQSQCESQSRCEDESKSNSKSEFESESKSNSKFESKSKSNQIVDSKDADGFSPLHLARLCVARRLDLDRSKDENQIQKLESMKLALEQLVSISNDDCRHDPLPSVSEANDAFRQAQRCLRDRAAKARAQAVKSRLADDELAVATFYKASDLNLLKGEFECKPTKIESPIEGLVSLFYE